MIAAFFSYFSRHLLVVFGGLKGLEASLESDEKLTENDPSLVFDHYINTCPGQGSGTIRTEEAILVTMSALRPVITKATRWKSGIWSDLRSTWKSLDVRVPLCFYSRPSSRVFNGIRLFRPKVDSSKGGSPRLDSIRPMCVFLSFMSVLILVPRAFSWKSGSEKALETFT